jgi:hypothetical protein
MNEKTEIGESAVEELFQLAEEKRAATGVSWHSCRSKKKMIYDTFD